MKGILIKSIGGFFFVADEKEKIYQTRIRGKIREKIYPGDIVEINEEKLTLEKVYARKNLLIRPKVANVDQVLIMQSINNPKFKQSLLDRFLLLIESSGFEPIIVINKIDCTDLDYKKEFKDYKKAGYKIYFISVKKNINIDSFMDIFNDKISVLTGPSGVGKSSFLNKVIEEADLPTAGVSKKLKKGVHTTRMVELLPISERGWIADTPGFSSMENIDLNIEADDLFWYFPEIAQYSRSCKFNRCTHTHEPNCTVQDKVKEGEISRRRYESYYQIYKELREKENEY
ncbi:MULTISPECIES: ribosome small subunit-dependent GTPase A [unclassified Halanaerobium]|uniref:ribosome small subunit-dependent GTPase A n=1 Tax=unclassified Halanaerobium TaxID=2641197 RepID=UPI000DF1F851|nr:MULTISPECIES: ribosome small subunit-dependent GTPase A [unclassified Halanaerobium]RCW51419.1 ribosome biogenesis GTPase [Halanaerobium sp. MA284_MarDTE_T2]RCW89208.1 ribosome biogenesis GTPase [Halanaerobium sp. DL-01]